MFLTPPGLKAWTPGLWMEQPFPGLPHADADRRAGGADALLTSRRHRLQQPDSKCSREGTAG